MTKERITLKTGPEHCSHCGSGDLDFIKVKCIANGFKFTLRCDSCGYKETKIEEVEADDDNVFIELLNSKYHSNTNFWLIRKGQECFIIEASKADMPDTRILPENIRIEAENRIKSFLRIYK